MKTKNTTDMMLAAVARLNPALPPRYSRVQAALELRGKTCQELALLALDEKGYGPGTKTRQTVARLAIERDGANAVLLREAFPNITMVFETGKWIPDALCETAPDIGEIKVCLTGKPGTHSAVALLADFWPTENNPRSPFDVPRRPRWDINQQRDDEYHQLMFSLARAAGEVQLADAAEWVEERWQECRGLEGDALRKAIEAWVIPANKLLETPSGHSVKFWLECKSGERPWWPPQTYAEASPVPA